MKKNKKEGLAAQGQNVTVHFKEIIPLLFQGKRLSRTAWRDAYIQMYDRCYFHFGPNPGDLVFNEPAIMIHNKPSHIFTEWKGEDCDYMADDWYIKKSL